MRGAVKIFKRAFLPVPEFPNYEINGELRVRNVKTGKYLRLTRKQVGGKIYAVYLLTRDKKRYQRQPELLYQNAFNAVEYDDYEWIPLKSLNCLYEINVEGKLRNAKTKNLLTSHKRRHITYYSVKVGVKKFSVNVEALLAEALGKHYSASWAVPVRLYKDKQAWAFDSLSAAARFLASRAFYTAGTIFVYLKKRPNELFGYKISYLESAKK